MSIKHVCRVIPVMVILVAGTAHSKENPAPKVFSEVRVKQFYGVGDTSVDLTFAGATDQFSNTVRAACGAPKPSVQVVAPIFAAIGGMVVDWLAKALVNKLNDRVQKYLASFTANYSNELVYEDFLAPQKWGGTDKATSCVVAQRVTCPIEDDAQVACRAGSAANSVAFRLIKSGPGLRVEPIAMEVGRLRAMHTGGDASFSYSVRIHALGEGANGGYLWDSGEVSLAAQTFDIPETGPESPIFRPFKLGGSNKVLPIVPSQGGESLAAIQVNFSEIGQPKRYIKHFGAFLAANKDGATKAFADAAKKKLKLTE